MDPREAEIEAIYRDARERAAGERAAYLDGACRGDGAMRARVEALLKVHDEAQGVLNAARTASTSSGTARLTEGPGTKIGPYKILQPIGEGGFGSVFMAEQERPVRRRVALKIIKLGMDTKQVIARFEAERQALALMDHPNIAKVLDAGATDTGRPYFVMELVKGDPFTEYCDTNNLPVRERLELFVTVCHAVQHAHQKGIIHRDIKPSNILVTMADGKPIPKVIDFGIAKATNARLTEKTLFTEFRQLIGTPEYMSPEQAEMSGIDIDTRSDIYSLGVMLYQLLTGTTPFDPTRLRSAAYEEIQRIIREEEPPRPSTRVSTLAHADTRAVQADPLRADKVRKQDTAEVIARRRRSDVPGLSRLIKGDLDWIVMKALEKDRTRRYATADALADDVERYLRDEQVLASPPSTLHKLRKFVRRNRPRVAATAAVVVLLGVGATATPLVLREARRARALEEEKHQLQALIESDKDARGGYREPAEDRLVRAQLATRKVTLDAKADPLERIFESLARQSAVKINVDWRALEQIDVRPGTPVSMSLSAVSLESALAAVLAPLTKDTYRPPRFLVQDGAIRISSDDELRRTTMALVYELTDLLANAPEGKADRLKTLTDIIQQSVDPEGWVEQGGSTGSMQVVGDTLFIKNTRENHRNIGRLLALLREGGIRGLDESAVPGTSASSRLGLGSGEAERKVMERLNETRCSVEFAGTPFGEALRTLADRSGVIFNVDWLSLEANGVKASAPVHLSLSDCRVTTALQLVLRQMQTDRHSPPAFEVFDNGVFVTSDERLSGMTKLCLYNVRGLIGEPPSGLRWDEWRAARMKAVADAMKETVDTEGWADNGGSTSLLSTFDDSLVIKTTVSNHILIREFIGAMRSPLSLAESGRSGAGGAAPPSIGADTQAVPSTPLKGAREILRRLREITGPVEFAGARLEDALRTLAVRADVVLNVDWAAFPDGAKARDRPVDLRVSECSVELAMNLLLDTVGTGIDRPLFDVLDSGVLIASNRAWPMHHRFLVFELDSLLQPEGGAPASGAERERRLHKIIEALQGLVDPEGWVDNGGDRNGLRVVENRLIVQTVSTLNAIIIQDFLAGLVKAGGSYPGAPTVPRAGQQRRNFETAIEAGVWAHGARLSRTVLSQLLGSQEFSADWKWIALRRMADESVSWLPGVGRERFSRTGAVLAEWPDGFRIYDLNPAISVGRRTSESALPRDRSEKPPAESQPIDIKQYGDTPYLVFLDRENRDVVYREIHGAPADAFRFSYWNMLSPSGRWFYYATGNCYFYTPDNPPALHFRSVRMDQESAGLAAPGWVVPATKWSGDGTVLAVELAPAPDVGPPEPHRIWLWREPDWERIGEVWLPEGASWRVDGTGTRVCIQVKEPTPSLMVLDVGSDREGVALPEAARHAGTFALSFDGNTVATGGVDGTVCLWDVADGRRRRTFRDGNVGAHDLTFHADGGRLLAFGRSDGIIRVWDNINDPEPTDEQKAATKQHADALINELKNAGLTADQIGQRLDTDTSLDRAVRRDAMSRALELWAQERWAAAKPLPVRP